MRKDFNLEINFKEKEVTDNPETELEQYISRQINIITYEGFKNKLTQEQLLNEVRFKCYNLWLNNRHIAEFVINPNEEKIELKFTTWEMLNITGNIFTFNIDFNNQTTNAKTINNEEKEIKNVLKLITERTFKRKLEVINEKVLERIYIKSEPLNFIYTTNINIAGCELKIEDLKAEIKVYYWLSNSKGWDNSSTKGNDPKIYIDERGFEYQLNKEGERKYIFNHQDIKEYVYNKLKEEETKH